MFSVEGLVQEHLSSKLRESGLKPQHEACVCYCIDRSEEEHDILNQFLETRLAQSKRAGTHLK
eukprot:CAMPEP_0115144006 /NCGR_PEP_ID=MMETSP0227-20121206/61144_1 /TAXON_ID=89957 /ORGANISM="Polarella glacialis, Strain CCMP 1383" /LENGTH=62 /DNA_ID=CAMNT_0002553013 /DNA_START=292 /DNA_END=480 /DNA_ORIENTATION=+